MICHSPPPTFPRIVEGLFIFYNGRQRRDWCVYLYYDEYIYSIKLFGDLEGKS
jgi:hypothetical protein